MTETQAELQGRTAVVTGGANGIGRAAAILLAERGARVFVADIAHLQENADAFARLNINSLQCDVRSEASLKSVIDQAVAETQRIDILINNAGVGMVKPVTDVTEDDWSQCIDTNLKAAFFGSKHAIRHMRQAGGGVIVNTASNAGLLPRAHDPVYSISKMALVALTKSLALCHAPDNIRINAVCPGPVGDTGMMNADLDQAEDRAGMELQFISASPLAKALGRMITPREVADAILYLASDAAMMVTGTMIAIDGGKSLGVPPR